MEGILMGSLIFLKNETIETISNFERDLALARLLSLAKLTQDSAIKN